MRKPTAPVDVYQWFQVEGTHAREAATKSGMQVVIGARADLGPGDRRLFSCSAAWRGARS